MSPYARTLPGLSLADPPHVGKGPGTGTPGKSRGGGDRPGGRRSGPVAAFARPVQSMDAWDLRDGPAIACPACSVAKHDKYARLDSKRHQSGPEAA